MTATKEASNQQFEGKVVVITGGGAQGIGRAIATKLGLPCAWSIETFRDGEKAVKEMWERVSGCGVSMDHLKVVR
jgi:NAD(P)-dependent dehydrogenase (short-subunit alcohol dehydrogenase family)